MWNPFDFSDRKYIVTGATSGIGKEIAIRLSQQGANVFLFGRNEKSLKETEDMLSGTGHKTYVRDLSISGDYSEIYDDIVADGRKIDGLVYSAGVSKTVPLSRLNKKTMDECMTINMYSFVEMVSCLSKKRYHNNSSIVGVSSIATEYPSKCQSVYVASKAALNSIASAMTFELNEKQIRINTVLAGATNTRMLREAYSYLSDKEYKEHFRYQLLGLIEPEDIASIVLFLLSDASKMITGRAIYADAGTIPDLSH